jgi:hypothetical protein
MDYALTDQTSQQFVGQWRRLVSTTNWEKGRIIHQWREALRATGAPAVEYSDEAWSRRVGQVTPQHVGRLRRVWERFAATHEDYDCLYWSHFQAALDWDDAEMWLEGAAQSRWSVAQMRAQRHEALGAVAGEPTGSETSDDELWDEDSGDEEGAEAATASVETIREPDGRDDDEADEAFDEDSELDDEASSPQTLQPAPAAEAVRPFAELPPLPSDVNEAFEAYKLCILRHKLAGWREITRDDMLASLDSLRQLALAPAES